jgi:hypothetical protein
MINVKESFELLSKGLALKGIKLDPDDIGSLKFGSSKSAPAVVDVIKSIILVFGQHQTGVAEIKSANDLVSFLKMSTPESISKEKIILMQLAWSLVKYNVIERIETEVLHGSIFFNAGFFDNKEDATDQCEREEFEVREKFENKDMEVMALIKTASQLERRIEALKNQKMRKFDVIRNQLRAKQFNYSERSSRLSTIGRKLELHNLIQIYPEYKQSIYMWFSDIAQDICPPQKTYNPHYRQFLSSKSAMDIVMVPDLLRVRKSVKMYLKHFKGYLVNDESKDKCKEVKAVDTLTLVIQPADVPTTLEMYESLRAIEYLSKMVKVDLALTLANQIDSISASISNVKIKRAHN